MNTVAHVLNTINELYDKPHGPSFRYHLKYLKGLYVDGKIDVDEFIVKMDLVSKESLFESDDDGIEGLETEPVGWTFWPFKIREKNEQHGRKSRNYRKAGASRPGR